MIGGKRGRNEEKRKEKGKKENMYRRQKKGKKEAKKSYFIIFGKFFRLDRARRFSSLMENFTTGFIKTFTSVFILVMNTIWLSLRN